MLFLGAAAYGAWCIFRRHWNHRIAVAWLSLMAVAWSAAVSWGYNLPILFAAPVLYVLWLVSERVWATAFSWPYRWKPIWLVLAAVLVLFRYANQYVYRDGVRASLYVPMGGIFPRLSGIYSSQETAALYRDLRELAARYPDFKTLPAFPQANYLTHTASPLPLDWIVGREMNGETAVFLDAARTLKPVFFIEKSWETRILSDPELAADKEIMENTYLLEETPHFWVKSWNN
ncbi:MAG: hypothetical protein IPL65_18030 [Lewinellaceae bacterium]|nr:hypothetical protein [Lewinellaceae bacterium]